MKKSLEKNKLKKVTGGMDAFHFIAITPFRIKEITDLIKNDDIAGAIKLKDKFMEDAKSTYTPGCIVMAETVINALAKSEPIAKKLKDYRN